MPRNSWAVDQSPNSTPLHLPFDPAGLPIQALGLHRAKGLSASGLGQPAQTVGQAQRRGIRADDNARDPQVTS
jgi:hypothetical protein